MPDGWIYIMTNRPDGTLYVGVTKDIVHRAWKHRAGLVEGFGSKRLVLVRRQAAREKYEALARRLGNAPDLWRLGRRPYDQLSQGVDGRHKSLSSAPQRGPWPAMDEE